MTAEPALHRFVLRVYYEDTDFSGVVYHASYLRFLERGRTELLRELGINQTDLFGGLSGQAIAFAVARMTIAFIRPARMDDLLTVETRRARIGGASLLLDQAIVRGAERLVEASVKVGAVADGRAVRLPEVLATKLAGDTAARGSEPDR